MTERRSVAAAGGSGLVGRFVVDALREAGPEPVVVGRSPTVDLATGAGLDQAPSGVHQHPGAHRW